MTELFAMITGFIKVAKGDFLQLLNVLIIVFLVWKFLKFDTMQFKAITNLYLELLGIDLKKLDEKQKKGRLDLLENKVNLLINDVDKLYINLFEDKANKQSLVSLLDNINYEITRLNTEFLINLDDKNKYNIIQILRNSYNLLLECRTNSCAKLINLEIEKLQSIIDKIEKHVIDNDFPKLLKDIKKDLTRVKRDIKKNQDIEIHLKKLLLKYLTIIQSKLHISITQPATIETIQDCLNCQNNYECSNCILGEKK